jgi:PEGA domain
VGGRGWGSGGFFVPTETVVTPPLNTPPDSFNELAVSGSLELAVEPRSADVYVDGFYVGTVDDVMQNGLLLRAGRHWVDLRAEGYETLTVPVGIAAGQTIRYRGELAIIRPQPDGAEAPRGPQTIYVIRGCYAGNRPPTESALPRGCDIANLRTITPR